MQIIEKLLIAFAAILLLVPCNAQNMEFKFALNDYSRPEIEAFDKDAARLALCYISDGKKPSEDDIEIPENVRESLFNALLAIYQSEDRAAIKVTRELGIHTAQKPFYVDRFIVVCDSDVDWLDPIREGQPKTSNERINELIDKYNLTINHYNSADNSFEVSAYPYLNIRALGNVFSKIKGINMIELPEVESYNSDIKAKYLGNDSWELKYVRYDNHDVTRNGQKQEWVFKVDAEGNVESTP